MKPSFRVFTDSDTDELTALLHRAYAGLGAAGLNFTAVDQSAGVTAERAGAGHCLLAVHTGRIVGTVTMNLPADAELHELTPEAAAPDTAWLNQFAVDPDRQGTGLGRELFRRGRDWALANGARRIGIDTAVPATHLVQLYGRWGFERRDTIQWPGKTYRSAILIRQESAGRI